MAALGEALLGSSQKSWLSKELAASKAPFKAIINEVPIRQLFVSLYDRCEGYLAEREELLRLID